jgi:solute:Na+ symporter, SSS family
VGIAAGLGERHDGEPVTTVHGMRHFGSSIADFPFTNTKVYIAASALVINVVVAVVLTVIFRAIKAPEGTDGTEPEDYRSDVASKQVRQFADSELAGG